VSNFSLIERKKCFIRKAYKPNQCKNENIVNEGFQRNLSDYGERLQEEIRHQGAALQIEKEKESFWYFLHTHRTCVFDLDLPLPAAR
jgi:hypothetical protein